MSAPVGSTAGGGGGAMFSVRIVTADYYLAAPLDGLDVCRARGSEEKSGRRVPVVRIFGATPAGQKTCLHLHGIFPYIYVPYDGHGQDPDRYLRLVAFSIDRALNVALGNLSSAVQHVFKISLVSGMPFYGYHEKERQFMKIYLYNPAMVKRVCELLQGGAVMNKCYQPHEAHVPYLLQLFIDYNLYGMNLINLAAVKFRKTRRKGDEVAGTGCHKDHLHETSFNSTFFRWEEDEIPSSLILDGVEPQSTCELEADGVAADILNRQEMEAHIGRNPGLQAIWEDEKQRRRDKNESSQISPPDSQDRGYVPATESERIFQKRIKEILKQNDFSVTLPGSLDYSNESDEFSAELTLHSEVLSPEGGPCTPANMVEVHKDQAPCKGNIKQNGSELQDAVIDEEAILNIMETSQTFQPLSQRLSQSPVFMNSSQDQALINLLAGLEDDGYQGNGSHLSQQQRLSENCSKLQNSDDEENEPQLAKDDMELSMLMSQRWDSTVEEDDAKRQLPDKCTNGSSTEEEPSSDDEMEWSGSNIPLTNLSIPQLDGTADENSDNPLNNESSRTHSSVIATSKMSVKNSIFHNDAATFEAQASAKTAFQCQHTSALSSHILKKEDLTAKLAQSVPEKGSEFSVRPLSNQSTYSGKYSAPFRSTALGEKKHLESNRKDFFSKVPSENSIYDFNEEIPPPVSRHTNCRKYTSVRKVEKDTSFMHSSRNVSDSTLERKLYNFSDFNHSTSKLPSDGNDKGGVHTANSFSPSALKESCDLVSCSGVNKNNICSVEPGSNEERLNKIKIRCEGFQEHKAEVTSHSQQAAHYMFFPSVVLSNCLNRPQKLPPVTYKLQHGTKQSRLKLCRRKMSNVSQESVTVHDKIDITHCHEPSDPSQKLEVACPEKPSRPNNKTDDVRSREPSVVNDFDFASNKETDNEREENALPQSSTPVSKELDSNCQPQFTTVKESMDLASHRKNSFSNKKVNLNETHDLECSISSSANGEIEKIDLICPRKLTTTNENIAHTSKNKDKSENDKIDVKCQLKHKPASDKLNRHCHKQIINVKEQVDLVANQSLSVDNNMDSFSSGQPLSVKKEPNPSNLVLSISLKEKNNSSVPQNHGAIKGENDQTRSQKSTFKDNKMDTAGHWQCTSVNEKLGLVNKSKIAIVNEKINPIFIEKPEYENKAIDCTSHEETAPLTETTLASHQVPTNAKKETALDHHRKSVPNNKMSSKKHKKSAFVKGKCDTLNNRKLTSANKKYPASYQESVLRNKNSDFVNNLNFTATIKKIDSTMNQELSTENDKVISDGFQKITTVTKARIPANLHISLSVSKETDTLTYQNTVSEDSDLSSPKGPSVNEGNNAVCPHTPGSHQKPLSLPTKIDPAIHLEAILFTEKMEPASPGNFTSATEKIDYDSHQINKGNGCAIHQKPKIIDEQVDSSSHPLGGEKEDAHSRQPAYVNTDYDNSECSTDVIEKTDVTGNQKTALVTEEIDSLRPQNSTCINEETDKASIQKPIFGTEEIDHVSHQQPLSVTEKVDPIGHQKHGLVAVENDHSNNVLSASSDGLIDHFSVNHTNLSNPKDLDGLPKPANTNDMAAHLMAHDVSSKNKIDLVSPEPNRVIISRHWSITGVNNKITVVSHQKQSQSQDEISNFGHETHVAENDKVTLDFERELGEESGKVKPVNQNQPARFNRRLGLISHRKAKNVKRVTCQMENCCSNGNSRLLPKASELSCRLTENADGAVESKIPESHSFASPSGKEGLDSEGPSGLHANKYKLRAKRKINYEPEEGEPSADTQASKTCQLQPIEASENADDSQKTLKRRKVANKLPPIIIKYIIVNRFKGQKNMLVKIGKLDHSEEQVKLTEENINMYKKMAPLKDFWPKVPDSPATKFPLNPPAPKKSLKRKTKQKSSKKKNGKAPQSGRKTVKRTFPLRRKKPLTVLELPSPSYNAETEDCDLDFNDVMSKLGFLSERSPSPMNLSPPRCWSPTDPEPENRLLLPKDNLCGGITNVFNDQAVKPNIGSTCHEMKAIKPRKKVGASSAMVNTKQNKHIPLEKGENKNKKQRPKPRRKIKEIGVTNSILADPDSLIVNSGDLQGVQTPQNIPVVSLSQTTPKPPTTQLDLSLSGFSTGHVPSSQLPSTKLPSMPLPASYLPSPHFLSTQVTNQPSSQQPSARPPLTQLSSTADTKVDLPSCFRALTGTDIPVDSPHHPLVHKCLQPAVSCFTSSDFGVPKINSERTFSQGIGFKMKESNFVQHRSLEPSKYSPQMLQSVHMSLGTASSKAEHSTPLLKRPMFMGRSSESNVYTDTIKTSPINTNNVFQYKRDNIQHHVMPVQDMPKQDIYFPENAHSGKNHGPINLPKNGFLMSLQSSAKPVGWDQNQQGDANKTNVVSQKLNNMCMPENTASTKVILANSGYTGTPPVPCDGQTGIDVLKELLYKRQQIEQQNHILQEPPTRPQMNQSGSSPPENNVTTQKYHAATSKKPKIPRNPKVKEKTPLGLKPTAFKQQFSNQSTNSPSNGSPVLLSDPDFESCYSIEDSLSPEHTYNFDINTIGQTGFCSLYSGSQFVPADQNLPQKFLSDAIHEPFPCQSGNEHSSHEIQKLKEEKPCLSHHAPWIKSSGPLSPDLFEKSSVDIKEDSCHSQRSSSIQPQILRAGLSVDSFCFRQPEEYLEEQLQRNRKRVTDKDISVSLPPAPYSSEWIQIGLNYSGKQASYDTCRPFNAVSNLFSGHLSSPDGEFMDVGSDDLELYISRHNEVLTPTPDSSPRSVSSPSQSKNGSNTPRTAHILKPLMSPPSREEIMATLQDHDLMETVYQEPFVSNPLDAPEKPREVGGRLLTVETRLPNNLSEFEGDFSLDGLRLWKTAFSVMTQNHRPVTPTRNCQTTSVQSKGNDSKSVDDKKLVIMPCRSAPTRQRTQVWLQAKEEFERSHRPHKSKLVKCASEKLRSEVLHDGDSVAPSKGMSDSYSKPASLPKHTIENGDIPRIIEHELSSCTRGSHQTPSKCRAAPDTQPTIEPSGEAKDEYYENCSSPESPILPSWQNVSSSETEQCNLDYDHIRQHDLTTTPVKEFCPVVLESVENHNEDDAKETFLSVDQLNEGSGKSGSICLHSTPVVQRRRRKSSSETLCCTPVSAEPKLKRLKHKRGDGPDRLRRVLLTTQLKNQFAAVNCTKKENSQIEGPTLNNSYGFKVTAQNLQEAKALHEVQNLTLISMELHARTRRDLEPDPEFDPICALFYRISSDAVLANSEKNLLTGAIMIEKDGTSSCKGSREKAPLLVRSGVTGLDIIYATDEKQLFQEVVNLVRRYDPDILLGYEVQMRSWGYLLQRASALDVDLCKMISRVPEDNKENRFAAEKDEYGADTMSEINVVGRIVLNVWRMMKNEVALTNYTFENVAFHVLHQRFPLFTLRVLSDWFDNETDLHRWKMVDHYISRVCGILQMLEQLDLIGRTSELARLFGIQFLHVLTRGSQYRVESMMLRIAKPMNYIAVTPSVQQRAQMRAPQCIPLVMEPESRFYSNSVLVLDFQSLYPSIVIAYNYCFSTCLGFVEHLGKYDEFKFGCASLRVPPDLLHRIRHDITVSPSGVAFVKASVRKGVLPRMLEDILKTRIMVKQSMKSYRHDKGITRMLDARQLGLKLIANVTFGYTAANFSGRMPCMEIGDSIVHKARETLERAIKLVNETKKWGARVVYGDTDSMFVLLKGATKEQSFKIGQEIADAVTSTNPKPVKLKFEKVYLPCVLQTKKRYVGYMYETLDQKDPVFDAKGIETVRRDACPAVGKILERSVKLLFETRDISQIKLYVQRQCLKLLEGKASMQDLIFAKEYRGSPSYRPGACVPALEITRKMLAYDRRSEPRVGERVPYVIVYGTPGVPLIQLVRRPIEVLQDPSLRLNATYYITKQILPPLNRLFSLIGVDVFSWYDELPRVQKACSIARSEDSRKGTISQYFTTLHCPVCDDLTQHGICSKCRSQPQQVAVILNQEIRELEHKQDQLVKICKNCTGCHDRQIQCVSLNCPVLFKLFSVSRDLSKAPYYRQLLDQF
ncbi:DNA polymerase zeta catalytic subunit isoform X2 [Pleurodeles waltl]|uniref:DNA polymerase zeta catalytic subunit isoform X2 n=1 Tax=Pleurodeles waltl TaxID=8319 RepID=UPI0037093910